MTRHIVLELPETDARPVQAFCGVVVPVAEVATLRRHRQWSVACEACGQVAERMEHDNDGA